MAVFLSPGVFPREVDLSVLPKSTGALRPAFVGAAKKGPLNTPTLIASAAEYVDVFGEPFAESPMGYAVVAYFEEGAAAWVMRVGVEFDQGLDTDVQEIAIDTSGSNVEGWGRLPVFSGIDNGKIFLREVTTDNPVEIHAAGVEDITYSDAEIEDGTDGATDATLVFSLDTYLGSVDEVFTMSILTDPDGSSGPIGGATYQIIDSGGELIDSGTLTTATDTSVSDDIVLAIEGLTFAIDVTSGILAEGDTFVWRAVPDNTVLTVSVEGAVAETITLSVGTYSDADALVTEINTSSPVSFAAVAADNDLDVEVPVLRTDVVGEWIQVTGTAAGAAEVGINQWEWDNPRSFLIGIQEEPFVITSSNNRIVMNQVSSLSDATTAFDFTLATGTVVTAATLATQFDANGTVGSNKLFEAFELIVPGGTSHLLITTTTSFKTDQLALQATFTTIETLRFTEEVGILFPYSRAPRGFADSRVVTPDAGTSDSTIPLSCEADPMSASCVLDSAYYANIVGFIVAKSAGTWVDDFRITVSPFLAGLGEVAGRFVVEVINTQGVLVDRVEDVSFDPDATRYISNVVNAGSAIGGVNGNVYYEWEERPSTVGAGDVRQPTPFAGLAFDGGADGIPTDPADSPLLDSAVIGNAGLNTGLFALSNPESYDFNLLAIPGFTSGPVIAQGLQFAENRGDVLYLVDPPFGLRPQQVIDWHNGMLTSDLTAALNTSYGALYWGYLKIADQFEGGTIFVPPSGHVSAVFARTARDAEVWFAPAGINRGRVLTGLDIEYNPNQGERDLLQGSGSAVNPLVNFIQDGIVVWGQRTLQRTQSALDRVNVRMLLIFIKRNLEETLRSFVFEQNDRFTRAQIRDTIRPFLADIVGRRGLTAFNVIVDETNNTPERIDRNELWISVFLQPTRTAEFIVLNLVTLRTGANFAAQEVLAAGGVVVTQ